MSHLLKTYSYNMIKSGEGSGYNKMLFSDFKCKEVINIRDCRCLGKVTNLEFDECSGCICKIIVNDSGRFFCLFKCDAEIVIPFKDIRQIGPDIILVDINC